MLPSEQHALTSFNSEELNMSFVCEDPAKQSCLMHLHPVPFLASFNHRMTAVVLWCNCLPCWFGKHPLQLRYTHTHTSALSHTHTQGRCLPLWESRILGKTFWEVGAGLWRTCSSTRVQYTLLFHPTILKHTHMICTVTPQSGVRTESIQSAAPSTSKGR